MNLRVKSATILLSAIAFLFCFSRADYFGASDMGHQNENRLPANKVALSLQAESSILRKGTPYFVSLTIENTSAKEFSLRQRATLSLEMAGQSQKQKQKFGPNFWSWIGFLTHMPVDSKLKRRETLLQGEKVSLRLDISQQKWGHSILSGYPSKTVFGSIPKGKYLLFFECEVDGKSREKARSNVVSIQVK